MSAHRSLEVLGPAPGVFEALARLRCVADLGLFLWHVIYVCVRSVHGIFQISMQPTFVRRAIIPHRVSSAWRLLTGRHASAWPVHVQLTYVALTDRLSSIVFLVLAAKSLTLHRRSRCFRASSEWHLTASPAIAVLSST